MEKLAAQPAVDISEGHQHLHSISNIYVAEDIREIKRKLNSLFKNFQFPSENKTFIDGLHDEYSS